MLKRLTLMVLLTALPVVVMAVPERALSAHDVKITGGYELDCNTGALQCPGGRVIGCGANAPQYHRSECIISSGVANWVCCTVYDNVQKKIAQSADQCP